MPGSERVGWSGRAWGRGMEVLEEGALQVGTDALGSPEAKHLAGPACPQLRQTFAVCGQLVCPGTSTRNALCLACQT